MTDVTARSGARRTRREVYAVIEQIIIEFMPNDELDAASVKAASQLVDDLGFHSLALLEMAFTIEDEFDLEPIDEQTASTIVTVGDVEKYVVARLQDRDAIADDVAATP